MPNHVETDVAVQRFGFTADEKGNRLQFPHAETKRIDGRAGSVAYGAADLTFDDLEGRLDTLRWTAGAASVGSAWLRDDENRIDLQCERVELPHGLRLVRADAGVEIIAPQIALSECKITVKGPFTKTAEAAQAVAAAEPAELRQQGLRFLDSLSGRINLTMKVVLDLPVFGKRTLDQQLKVPIHEGSLDFRALDDSLDWLEGAFLDISYEGDDQELAVTWKVPIVGTRHDLITWKLDKEAATLASFGRVPIRSLADFHAGSGPPGAKSDRKRKLLQSFSLDAIDVVLSLLAPRSVEAGGGLIMFGDDAEPGMVDLKVTGAIKDSGPGSLKGAIGSVDTTIKDVQAGPIKMTADRLRLDGLDRVEVAFDGFSVKCITAVVHRITATNLSVQIGGNATAKPSPPVAPKK